MWGKKSKKNTVVKPSTFSKINMEVVVSHNGAAFIQQKTGSYQEDG